MARDTVPHGAEFRLSKARPKTIGSYYLDPTGPTRLRAALPEENVRQQFIKFLTDESRVGVPLSTLTTEDPVSHHGAHHRGRMDIFCKLPGDIRLFVVECKEPSSELDTEQHLRQVHRYAKQVRCKLAILTNGDTTYVYDFKTDNRARARAWPRLPRLGDLQQCKLELRNNTVPTFQEMLLMENATYERLPAWHRPAWEGLPKSVEDLRDKRFKEMIGEYSGIDRIRWMASLGSLLLDARSVRAWQSATLGVKDRGTAKVSPTNRSGGDWRGEYRGFLVTRDHAEHAEPQIARFRMAADWKGKTTLVVAVDDENGKTRNQLQLDMDFADTVEQSGKTAIIWHNGRLGGGVKGRTKAALIDYARRCAPRLVKGEYVRLGEIPINRHVKWSDAREFITNCIEYALLRKRFRDAH